LKKTSAIDRLRKYEEFFVNQSLQGDTSKKNILRVIYLERYLLTLFTRELPIRAMKKIKRKDDLRLRVSKIGQKLLTLNLAPWAVLHGRYGVPTWSEFEEQYGIFLDKRKLKVEDSLQEQFQELQHILGDEQFARELREIESFKKIKNLTNSYLIQAHRP
jgi:hypothetical protein